MPPVRILTVQPSLANNPFVANTGPIPLGTTFEEFLSRPCIELSAFSNSFDAEAAILLPILNKRKKRVGVATFIG